ncbi:MAG TPA: thioredoxin domain-containing protein [bacterium]|nr:thioredoxin domain-containing protein [bacterium]
MDKEKKEEKNEKTTDKKMNKKKLIFIIISAVVLLILALLVFKLSPKKNDLNINDAKVMAEEFINNNLMLPGTKATIKEITKEYGLYKLSIDLGDAGTGELIDSYISQDGELFFPQSINIQEYENSLNSSSSEKTEVTNKTDKPVIELFVMSECPYGTQIEKGLISVLETLKDSVDFKLKFNTYAMHEKAELDEEMTQYCIQKENNDKLLSYLSCYVKSGKSDDCLSETGINKNDIDKCVEKTDKEYKISESYADKSTWLNDTYPIFPIYQEDNDKYGVEGSPTLIINGEMVSSARDSQSLLNLVCSSFNTAPESCQTQLSTTEPGYGFGE